MRTTLNINDAILRELRARAKDTGRPIREVVEEALAVGLAHGSPRRRTKPFKVKPHRLGLKPGFHGVSLNQLYDQVEAEDNTSAT